jgi:uncharacterized protein YcbK (DUF882 family)
MGFCPVHDYSVVVSRAVLALILLSLPGTLYAALPRSPDAGVRQTAPAKRADAGVRQTAPAKRADAGVGRASATRPDAGAGKRPGTPAAKSGPNAKTPKTPRNPVVELFQVNTKEIFKLRFADDRGRPIPGWQKRFQRFMRCHHTNTQHRMDPRLPRLLYQAGKNFYGHRIEVISGYRSPKVARNPKSPHKLGLACDFRIAGIGNAALRDYLRKSFQHVGVGFYPNSMFVHLDVRKGPSAFWIDYSGPGENAAYSGNAGDDLRTGRVDWYTTGSSKRRTSADDESVDDLMDMAVKGTPPSAQRAAGVAAPTK